MISEHKRLAAELANHIADRIDDDELDTSVDGEPDYEIRTTYNDGDRTIYIDLVNHNGRSRAYFRVKVLIT